MSFKQLKVLLSYTENNIRAVRKPSIFTVEKKKYNTEQILKQGLTNS